MFGQRIFCEICLEISAARNIRGLGDRARGPNSAIVLPLSRIIVRCVANMQIRQCMGEYDIDMIGNRRKKPLSAAFSRKGDENQTKYYRNLSGFLSKYEIKICLESKRNLHPAQSVGTQGPEVNQTKPNHHVHCG